MAQVLISDFVGKYPPPPGVTEVLGLEATGEVVKTGPDCKKFKEGDRVMALLAGGGYAEFVAVGRKIKRCTINKN